MNIYKREDKPRITPAWHADVTGFGLGPVQELAWSPMEWACSILPSKADAVYGPTPLEAYNNWVRYYGHLRGHATLY